MKSPESVVRRITLRELRLLLAVASAGSILKAAERVGITQPALSRAISELESTLGVRLFDRSRHGVEPTPHGQVLLLRAQGALDEMRLAVEELDALTNADMGEVRVGGTPAMCGGFLAHVVAAFDQLRPSVCHQVSEMPSERLAGAVRERDIDLAVGREPVGWANDNIVFERLFDDRMFVVAGESHPLATRRKIDPANLDGQRWVLPPSDSPPQRQLVEGLIRAGAPRLPLPSVIAMSITMRCELLATGRFLTAFHGSTLWFGRFPGLRVLPLDLSTSIPIGLSRLRGRTLTPATEAFAASARKVATRVGALTARELSEVFRRRATFENRKPHYAAK